MLDGEKLFPIPKAFEIETGVRISPATAHRLRLRGRLETVKLGGRRMTSIEAVRRFIEATTRAADGEPRVTQSRPNRQQESRIALAELKMRNAGA
jgi:hypothetical protein